MIEHPHSHQRGGPAYPFREASIFGGGSRVPRRVVVKTDDARRRSENRWFQDVRRNDVDGVDCSNGAHFFSEDQVSRVERQDEELLPGMAAHTMAEKVVYILAARHRRSIHREGR